MSDRYLDLGPFGSLSATVDALTVNGVVIPHTPFPMFPRLSRNGQVAYKRHEDGAAILARHGWAFVAHHLPTVGNWPCAWGPDNSLYLRLLNGTTVEYHRLHPDGRDELLDMHGKDAAEGFHHIEDDGEIVLGNDRRLNGVIHGIRCWGISDDPVGPYITALSDGGGPAGCVVRINTLTGEAKMWVAPTDLPFPPRVYNGQLAISGRDTPEPQDTEAFLVPFRPYVAPAPSLPPWPSPMPILIGCLSHTPSPSDPGTIGNVGTAKAVLIEGYRQHDGAPWTPLELRSQQRLIYVDWKESQAKAAMLANAKADQDAYGGTLVFYFDGAVADLPDDLAQLRQAKAEGRAVAMGLMCYPAPGQAYEMFVRVTLEIEQYQVEFPSIVLFAAGYQQAWSEIDARKAMRFAADLAHDHPSSVKAIVITKRPPYLADLLADHAALCALSQGADVDALFQIWTKPKPVVVAPVEPKPVAVKRPWGQPKVAPTPKLTWKSFWAKLFKGKAAL